MFAWDDLQTNGLHDGQKYHGSVDHSDRYTLRRLQNEGGRVSRLRVLTEWTPMGRFADISYCHGELPDGRTVSILIDGPESHLIQWNKFSGVLIDWAKSQGVFAKGLGLLDRANWSVLY